MICQPFSTSMMLSFESPVNKLGKGDVIKETNPTRYYEILSLLHRSKQQREAVITADVEELISKKRLSKKFRISDNVELADLRVRNVMVKEVTDEHIALQDEENEDTIFEASKKLLDALQIDTTWLIPSFQCLAKIDDEEGTVVTVILPEKVICTVAECEPAQKGSAGDRASGKVAQKRAVLDNGLVTRVPSFIGPGEKILVKTSDASYVERANQTDETD